MQSNPKQLLAVESVSGQTTIVQLKIENDSDKDDEHGADDDNVGNVGNGGWRPAEPNSMNLK